MVAPRHTRATRSASGDMVSSHEHSRMVHEGGLMRSPGGTGQRRCVAISVRHARHKYNKRFRRRRAMPTDTRVRRPFAPALDLPPAFRLVSLREVGDAFARAQEIAADEGAGTLVWVGRFDLVEFAVVLEPDEPLRAARCAFYAGMAALADALAVHAPPEKPIAFDWPDAVRVDRGLVGGGRLAWPADAREEAPPPWLVFGATVRTVALSDGTSGLRPIEAALEDEGFDDLGSGRLVESF